MLRRKAHVAIAVAALLVLGGAIVALADPDPSERHGNRPARAGTPGLAGAPAAVPGSSAAVPGGPVGAPGSSAGAPGAPCGPSTSAVVAAVDGQVAERIYAGELHGTETLEDRRQIAGYAPLIGALRSGDGAAIRAAVHELVYSHTHIVRLRVTRGTRLLADIGGPYILAPVPGTIRSGGRTLARFSFSVQDDLGFIKLVTRFAGVPLVLRTPSGQIPVAGQAALPPTKIADRGPVAYRGLQYQAYSFPAQAYPAGALRVSLLSPPRTGLAASSCAQVRTIEVARVAGRIARRFSLAPSNLHVYAELVRSLTLAKVIVKAGGRTYLAGGGRVPHSLPASGSVKLGGRRYELAVVQLPTSVGTAREWVLLPG
jgi:hypothetical protein